METKDGYEKELNLHIERERAAVKLQSKVGELLYDKGIELVLFRNHLTDITISEILNLHEYAALRQKWYQRQDWISQSPKPR